MLQHLAITQMKVPIVRAGNRQAVSHQKVRYRVNVRGSMAPV
jgi:hypothetical protein